MGILKKIGLDILITVVLFVVAVFVAGAVSMANPSCVTCGANIATTFWFAAVLALQPVLWVANIRFISRVLAWVSSLVAGAAVYLVLEALAGYLLISGAAPMALRLGFLANSVGVLTSLLVSFLFVRTKRGRAIPNTDAGATVEP